MEKYPSSISNQFITPYSSIPVAVKRARMNKIYDYDRNKYFDFYLNQGSVLLGYQHKRLSLNLKNTLSYGFYNSYPSHLLNKAKKSVLNFLQTYNNSLQNNFTPLFFISEQNLSTFIQKNISEGALLENLALGSLPLEYKTIQKNEHEKILYIGNYLTTLSDLNNISDFSAIILGSVLANGMPVYTLLVKKNIVEYSYNFDIPIFLLQSIITTLEIMKNKNHLESIFQLLMKPFQNTIKYLGSGVFTVKNVTDESINTLTPQLLKNCLLTSSSKAYFFLCIQTESHSIKYLLNTLKKNL